MVSAVPNPQGFMCSVCREMLHIWIGDGISEWRHRQPGTDTDHSPRPVLPDQTSIRCIAIRPST